MLNKTKVTGEVVLMEKFYNSQKVPYSKIYLKLTGINGIRTARAYLKPKLAKARIILAPTVTITTTIAPAIYNNSNSPKAIFDYLSSSGSNIFNTSSSKISSSSSSTSSVDNSLLFKLRTVFFRNALPSVYRDRARNVIERAWTSRLDRREFESQNGLRVEVAVIDVAHFLTIKGEHTFGYKYTVSVNGQDPESMGIQEPTYADFARESRPEGIDFCPCKAYEVQRVYIKSQDVSSLQQLRSKIDSILQKAWDRLNNDRSPQLATNRFVVKNKLDVGFYDLQHENVTRVELNWLVDGAHPNPIYFNLPKIEDLVDYFANASTPLYQGIPLISGSVKLAPAYNHSQHKELLKFAILSAWMKENPELKNNIFYVSLADQEEEDETSHINDFGTKTTRYRRGMIAGSLGRLATTMSTKLATTTPSSSVIVRYFVGVNERQFDVSEVHKPSARLLQAEMRQHLPASLLFNDDLADDGVTSSKDIDRNPTTVSDDLAVSFNIFLGS